MKRYIPPNSKQHEDNNTELGTKKSKDNNTLKQTKLEQRNVQLGGSGINSIKTSTNLKMLSKSAMPDWLPPNPLNPELFTSKKRVELKQAYDLAKPYRHVQIESLCTHDAMQKIQNEIIHYLPTSSRETDLFKVNQSIDLNNVDLTTKFAKQIPTLLSLRNYLYSQEFRELLQDVTSCNEIIDTVDCAANVYSGEHGNHLLVHDDVITTRVLSYIIYLPLVDINEIQPDSGDYEFNDEDLPPNFDTKNEYNWAHKMGGHLELFDHVQSNVLPFGVYPSAQDHIRETKHTEQINHLLDSNIIDSELAQQLSDVNKLKQNQEIVAEKGIELPPRAINIPISIPSKQVSPNFNTMVVFEVKPEESYHAVQEVYSINSKRISIQGWFHQQCRQPDYGATLRMLQVPTVEPTEAINIAAINAERRNIEQQQSNDNDNNKEEEEEDPEDNQRGRDILKYVETNRLTELTKEEVEHLTFAMFPSRQFELFKFINDDVLQANTSNDNIKDSRTDNNVLLQQEEIDYLTKMVLLHVKNVMLKQKFLLQQAKLDPTICDSKATDNNNKSTQNKTNNMNDNNDVDNDSNNSNNNEVLDDIDLDEPEIIKKDLQFLRKFISPEYTSVGILKQLQQQFDEQDFLQLGSFLKHDIISTVIKALIKTDVVDRIALVPELAFLLDNDGFEGEFTFDGEGETYLFDNATEIAADSDDDSMDFDFSAMPDDEDDEEEEKEAKHNKDDEAEIDAMIDDRLGDDGAGSEDSMDFDFSGMMDDEDDEKVQNEEDEDQYEEETIPTSKKRQTFDEATKTTTDNTWERDAVLTSNYKQKPTAPKYLTGIDRLSLKNTMFDQLGLWKLSGPAYLQRYAYYESVLKLQYQTTLLQIQEANHLAKITNGESSSTLGFDLETEQANWSWLDIYQFFATQPIHTKAGLILEALTSFLFGSIAFKRFIEWVTTDVKLLCYRSCIRRLRCGLDYSVGNYNDMIEAKDQEVMQKFVSQSVDVALQNAQQDEFIQNIIDLDSIDKSKLAMLDVVLSFCDNGQFDHQYASNLWENNDDNENCEILKTTTSAITTQVQSIESVLYPGANDDKMLTDISPFLADDDEEEEEQNDIENVNGFKTIPKCHVRFKQKQERWLSDDTGGFLAYIPVDKTTEGDDAQQYVENNAEDEAQLISLSLQHNTLTICKHKPDVLSFVRYVNYLSPGSRWDVTLNCIYSQDQ